MTDIFISYKRSERAKCALIESKLRALGLSVWFDAELEGGQNFPDVIEARVREARVVLVLWSKAAAMSQWVKAEASIGLAQGKLVAASLEPVNLPLPFNNLHTVDLSEWDGSERSREWMQLLRPIERLLQRKIIVDATQAATPHSPPPRAPTGDADSKPARNTGTRRTALLAGVTAVGGGALWLGSARVAGSVGVPAYEGELAFLHGVASGDPKQNRVVIWTRVTPQTAGPVPVRWIVARNRELSDVVKTGVVNATDARDYTVKVDVTNLRPGATYFYGFRAGGARSLVGRTRTLPRGRLQSAKIAVASCASYPHGFFNAYAALGERDDVDVVVHLGDYIYEYGLSGYGGDQAIALGRIPAPEVECLRLQDYRLRHAQYKSQAELQAAHLIAPWVVVWDDHEVANDSWIGGAENHQQSEGEWSVRKAAALQAYYEWMPIREPEAGRAFESINRSFQYGDLFTLIMLETRLLARDEPHDYARNLPIEMQRWNFTNPAAPVALRTNEPDVPAMQRFPAIYEQAGEELRPVLDWRRAQGLIQQARALPAGFFLAPDRAAIDGLLANPPRQLLGDAQQQWLGEELSRSQRGRTTWQVIGNQIVMAPVLAPDLSDTPAPLAAALERLRPGVTQLLKLTRFPFPLNIDAWDGYPAARGRVLEAIRAAGGNTLVITGDSHTAWANEISDGQGLVAVEFGGTSITSPSESDYFTPAGIDFNAAVRARNPHIKYCDGSKRGFLLLTLTREQALAEYMTVSTIQSATYETTRAAAFTVAPTDAAGVGPLTPV